MLEQRINLGREKEQWGEGGRVERDGLDIFSSPLLRLWSFFFRRRTEDAYLRDKTALSQRSPSLVTRIHLRDVPHVDFFSFLSVGESEVIFKLKEEDSYPGKYHCDVGTVYDTVRMKVTIAVSFDDIFDYILSL